MRSGIKKRTSKCSKRKLRASRGALHRSIVTSLHWTCDSMAKDFRARRGEATCQINVTIAKLYKVTVDDLQNANHIEDGRKLQAGQTIIIPTPPPAGSSSSSPN